MKWTCLVLVLVACSNADGTRGQCAEGGELADCPEAERTVEGACWRLVDCGAIPLNAGNDQMTEYRFDWNRCVLDLDTARTDQQRIVIDCIAASTCDSLKQSVDGDNPQIACLVAGGID